MASYPWVTLFSLLSVCYFFSISNGDTATATWYGAPEGFGSDGGACGYGGAVGTSPLNKFITAVNPSLFQNGHGCGECYQVKCNSNPACSGSPVTVTITDSCPGCEPGNLFDLSGTAFGAMANTGQANALRTAGKITIDYQRVPCNYPGANITFKVDPGSNPNYFSTTIEFENGDGDLSAVEVQNGSGPFIPMELNEGATWKLNSPASMLDGPFSIRLTTLNGMSITAQNAIPVGWKPGETYVSTVNF